MKQPMRREAERYLLDLDDWAVPDVVADTISGTVAHRAYAGGVHTRIVTTAAALLLTAAATGAEAGGIKIFAPPAGVIYDVDLVRVRGTLDPTAATATTTAGEIGLGSAAGAGDNATLGTTSGDEDWCTGITLGNIAAAGTLDIDVVSAAGVKRVNAISAAKDIYLNLATTVGVAATSVNLLSGATIDLYWRVLGKV